MCVARGEVVGVALPVNHRLCGIELVDVLGGDAEVATYLQRCGDVLQPKVI